LFLERTLKNVSVNTENKRSYLNTWLNILNVAVYLNFIIFYSGVGFIRKSGKGGGRSIIGTAGHELLLPAVCELSVLSSISTYCYSCSWFLELFGIKLIL
jgi:hypothetical protein